MKILDICSNDFVVEKQLSGDKSRTTCCDDLNPIHKLGVEIGFPSINNQVSRQKLIISYADQVTELEFPPDINQCALLLPINTVFSVSFKQYNADNQEISHTNRRYPNNNAITGLTINSLGRILTSTCPVKYGLKEL